MIISESCPRKEFERLLEDAYVAMNESINTKEAYFLTRGAQKLEEDLHEQLLETAKGTSFENNIRLISGFRFPDIVAKINDNNGFGVEVKTTKKNDWKCIGNSVLESTRETGIERIYLFFGKLHSPVRFKYRLYQECLPEVSVTHSPRYQIDMNLAKGKSIFDKMGISYDALRTSNKPIKPIVDYYKSKLSPGESVWWMADDDEPTQALDFQIKFFNSLSDSEKRKIENEMSALFPEILRDGRKKGSRAKYNRASIWLVNKGIATPCIRDSFSAGGQMDLVIDGQSYPRLPQQIGALLLNANAFLADLNALPEEILKEMWGTPEIGPDRLSFWLDMIKSHIKTHFEDNPDFVEAFNHLFRRSLDAPCQEIKK